MVLEYLREAKAQNSQDLREIVALRDHRADYEFTGFSFSTFLYRLKVFQLFTMLLPKTSWRSLDTNTEDSSVYLAGNDANSGMIMLKIRSVSPDYDIFADTLLQNETSRVVAGPPDENDRLPTISFRKGPFALRAKSVQIGNAKFRLVYDRITLSPKESRFQTLVEYTRYFLSDGKMISITVFN